MRSIPLENGPVRLVGALDLDRSATGSTPRRLPDWTRPQVPAFMEYMVTQPSGVRLEFTTDSRTFELDVMLTRLEFPGRMQAAAVFDLVLDDADIRAASAASGNRLVISDLTRRNEAEFVSGDPVTIRFGDLPAGAKRLELWLPSNAIVELRAFRVDDTAEIEAGEPQSRRRWVHHGSSISHCSGAHSPCRTWPAVTARLADVELLNLGFGGNCQLDQFVARTIRDEPADVISLKAGINIVNADSLKERTYAPALHGFLDTVREGQPDTPILVASPIICPSAETNPGPTVPNADGIFETIPGHESVRPGSLTLQHVRSITETVIDLRQPNDPNLHYLDGLELFGPADVDDLPDALHPSPDGYVRIGERFGQIAFGPGGPLAG